MKNIQLFEDLSPSLLIDEVFEHIFNCGFDGEPDFQPTLICLVGSRIKENYKVDSDLDIAIQYRGNLREDSVFNALNEEPLYIEGLKVDFLPYNDSIGNVINLDMPYFVLFTPEEIIEDLEYDEDKMRRLVEDDVFLSFNLKDLLSRNHDEKDVLRILFNSYVLEDSDMGTQYKIA